MEVLWSQPYEEGKMQPGRFLAILGLILMAPNRSAVQDYDLQLRNDRNAFKNTTVWIYDDLAAGIRVARQSHKPLLVVFRCIPCKACQAFDDDVARRDPIIRDLLSEFVCIRIPQANGLDLAHFQFDFDLSFAVFFMDSDLTTYGRYGTRSGRPETEDISLEGLRKAMAEALRIHRNRGASLLRSPANKPGRRVSTQRKTFRALRPNSRSPMLRRE
jgi:hypothetical protein